MGKSDASDRAVTAPDTIVIRQASTCNDSGSKGQVMVGHGPSLRQRSRADKRFSKSRFVRLVSIGFRAAVFQKKTNRTTTREHSQGPPFIVFIEQFPALWLREPVAGPVPAEQKEVGEERRFAVDVSRAVPRWENRPTASAGPRSGRDRGLEMSLARTKILNPAACP